MLETKGFQFIIRNGVDELHIENVDKDGYISFINDGHRYDIPENDFLVLVERLQIEAEKIKKKQAKKEPKTVIDFGDKEPVVKSKKTKK